MKEPRCVGCLIALYPADFRARFEAEVRATTVAALGSANNPWQRVRCAVREVGGLAAGAVREWGVKLADDPLARARALPDCRLMRPIGVTRAEWAAGLSHIRCGQSDS